MDQRPMRISLTIGEKTRARALAWINDAPPGSRVTLIDGLASEGQQKMILALTDEISRRIKWHGSKLTPNDWRNMLIATLKHHRVMPGIDDSTMVILGAREELTAEEASNLIEAAIAFGAEQGIQLGAAPNQKGDDT
jgi:hypothetical protein